MTDKIKDIMMSDIMTDVFLESLRFIILVGILFLLVGWWRKSSLFRFKSFYLVFGGFILLTIASLLDITDNFDSLNRYIVIGDTEIESVLEKVVGYTGGFVLLLLGFRSLLPVFNKLNSAEIEIKSQQGLYQTLFESANAAIMLIKEDRFINCNKKALEMFGCKRDQIIGQSHKDFSPNIQSNGELSSEKFMTKIAKATVGDPQFFEWKHKRIDGTPFDAEVSISAIHLEGDATVQAIVRDITERVQAEKKLEDYKNGLEETVKERTTELEEANKDLAAFSYSVSHDLRAPLRAIDGFSEALIEDCSDQLDKDGLDYLNRVRAGAQRMSCLIEDLLALSRVTQRELSVVGINLSDIVISVVSQLKSDEPERQVETVVQNNVTVKGDTHLVKIAIENLMNNAWKYTSKTKLPRIEFGASENGGKTVCYVKDNGVGFDMRYVDNLFNPFQRLHDADDFPGLGVGLATVKRITLRHGGKIWAEAEVDKGATFSFVLS
ncbi:MAG: PAS domain S-box protein [Candidatus Scalindua sp.]|nr:PAS domain S-box protein [Candidatus Scalindua sp.]